MKKILLLSVVVFMAFSCANKTQAPEGNNNKKAKYIFLFIGDGMGHSIVSATESYLSYKAGKIGGEQLTMTSLPVTGDVTTYSHESIITCSAAAGTAIACGVKTTEGQVGRTPDGTPARSIAYELKDEGYKIGIMSSVPINHATPAAFFSTPENRNDYYGITEAMSVSGFEFFASTGFLGYYPDDKTKPDSEALVESNGYEVVWGREELADLSPEVKKVVLCNPGNKGKGADNYEIGSKVNPDNFTLPEMLSTAIEFLSDEEPFFIMCEGGHIDWAAHSNKVMSSIAGVIEMDDAVKVAYEFYKKHPEETLIVITADHETGGISLGYGEDWDNSKPKWNVFEEAWNAAGQSNTLSSEENRRLNAEGHIGWTTSYHTGANVPLYAVGKGAEKFCGRLDNTDIKGKILGE
jgi:alkaline phosphatase